MSSPCQCGKRLSLIHFHTCGYSVHQKLVGTSFLFNTPSLSSLQDATHKCVTKIHLPMIDITMYLNQYSLYGLTKCLVDFSNYPDYPARWMKMNELCFFFFLAFLLSETELKYFCGFFFTPVVCSYVVMVHWAIYETLFELIKLWTGAHNSNWDVSMVKWCGGVDDGML